MKVNDILNDIIKSDENKDKMVFDFGRGWIKILRELFEELSKIELPEGFEILQMKEKFGGLRVYAYPLNNEITKAIIKAENDSMKTCEICGKRGRVVLKNGRFITLCEEHKNEN